MTNQFIFCPVLYM